MRLPGSDLLLLTHIDHRIHRVLSERYHQTGSLPVSVDMHRQMG